MHWLLEIAVVIKRQDKVSQGSVEQVGLGEEMAFQQDGKGRWMEGPDKHDGVESLSSGYGSGSGKDARMFLLERISRISPSIKFGRGG